MEAELAAGNADSKTNKSTGIVEKLGEQDGRNLSCGKHTRSGQKRVADRKRALLREKKHIENSETWSEFKEVKEEAVARLQHKIALLDVR